MVPDRDRESQEPAPAGTTGQLQDTLFINGEQGGDRLTRIFRKFQYEELITIRPSSIQHPTLPAPSEACR